LKIRACRVVTQLLLKPELTLVILADGIAAFFLYVEAGMNRRQAMAAIGASGSVALVGNATAIQPPVQALKVSVVIPELYDPDGKLAWQPTIRNAGYGLHFFVVVENVSNTDVYVWAEGNSAGYSTVSFEATGPEGGKTIIKREPIVWGKNIIRAERVIPGGYHVRSIEYDTLPGKTPQWESFPFGAKESRREVTLQAIFEQSKVEQPRKDKDEKLTIWSGRIVSIPLKVILMNA
jgi:hypothetical protein